LFESSPNPVAEATLLHNDEDFERIKKVRKGLRTERG